MRGMDSLLFSVSLALLAASAQAGAFPRDTVATTLADACFPVVATEPATGIPHVAYVNQGNVYHAWKPGPSWQTEIVATGVVGGRLLANESLDFQIMRDGTPIALYRRADRLEFAMRVNGVWAAESVSVTPTVRGLTLAVSPATGESVAAWGWRPASSTAPYEIRFARRAASGWSVQTIDTTSAALARVNVAIGPDNRPMVVYGRPRGDGLRTSQVLTCATASAPNGPFVLASLDSGLTNFSALALDPSSGEPRIVYNALGVFLGQTIVRYAALDGVNGWEFTDVGSGDVAFTAPALAIDAFGAPFVTTTHYTPVGPADGPSDATQPEAPQIFVRTGILLLFHRSSGAGTAPFQGYDYFADFDVAGGPRAIASLAAGVVAVSWRAPGQNIGGLPSDIEFGVSTPLAGVVPEGNAHAALAPIAPNPARLDGALRLSFTLTAAAEVTLDLHDLAGRSIATHAPGLMNAGAHTLEWVPRAPREGIYWVTLRANGVRLGARRAAIVR